MKKPKWLKTTPVKKYLSHQVARLFFFCTAFLYKSGNKILIVSTDGLGDAVVRLSLVDQIANHNGRDRVIVLTKKLAIPLYDSINVKYIEYGEGHKTNFFKRCIMSIKINSMGVQDVYCLHFIFDEYLLDVLKARNKIGYKNRVNSNFDKQFTHVLPIHEYVGESIKSFAEYIGLGFTDMDNRKLLPNKEKIYDFPYVVVAVGASSFDRMIRRTNMVAILKSLLPLIIANQGKIVFVGNGLKEVNYTRWLVDKLGGEHVINDVGKYSLSDTIALVNECHLLIGFDSGLYNLSFSLQRPTICLAANNHIFLHYRPWVKIVHGSGEVFGDEDGFGCDKTNSITPEQVLVAYHEMMAVDIAPLHA